MFNRVMVATLLLQNAGKVGMRSWEVRLCLECALVELHRLVNAVLLSFNVSKVVQRVSMFWMQLQSLLVAAFRF